MKGWRRIPQVRILPRRFPRMLERTTEHRTFEVALTLVKMDLGPLDGERVLEWLILLELWATSVCNPRVSLRWILDLKISLGNPGGGPL